VFNYNQGRNFTAVMLNPNGKGYIVTATNVIKGITIEVSNVIESYDAAYYRAMRFAGHSVKQDLESYDQWLSEKLGF